MGPEGPMLALRALRAACREQILYELVSCLYCLVCSVSSYQYSATAEGLYHHRSWTERCVQCCVLCEYLCSH